MWLAALALVAFVVAIAAGVTLDRTGVSTDLQRKLKLLLAVVTLQFGLTLVAPFLQTEGGFGVWILACAASIGVGMPTTFSLVIDFVPVEDRWPSSQGSSGGASLPCDNVGHAVRKHPVVSATVGFLTATELLALVPVVGSVVTLGVLLTAVGAVFITYFGLRQFQPPQLQPPGES